MLSSLNASLQLVLVEVLEESPNLDEVLFPPGDSNLAARSLIPLLVLLGLPNLDNEDADPDPESLLARLDLQLDDPIPDEEEEFADPYFEPVLEYPEFSLADVE